MRSISLLVGTSVLAAALAVAACEQRGDDPHDRVTRALEDANMGDVNVDYDRDAKVIHLKGTVPTPADRERAEEVAERAVGTSGTVLNELTVEGLNERSADDADGRIRDQLNDRVEQDAELKEHNIDFDVSNGAVKIEGAVASEAQRTRVTEMARAIPGVKEVANSLEVKREAGRSDAPARSAPGREAPDRAPDRAPAR